MKKGLVKSKEYIQELEDRLLKMADRVLAKHGADDVFPTAPPCPTCGRRVFLNDELAKQLLPTCQRCRGYGYLVNSSDGSKSKCPECSLPPKLHINPKWSKEEIIQAVEEYNAELDMNYADDRAKESDDHSFSHEN